MPDRDDTQQAPGPTGEAGAPRPRRAATRRRHPADSVRGRLRAHDPFELIRWLAMSQPDPRKALAELVQNSLDAGARRIRVLRVRERGVATLSILDDGEGVIPEMDRPEALRYIATHVGHSRKRSLSPEQRLALMTQGQYGIGLLGFWSLGETLDMRSSVPNQRAHRLVLHRDRADYLIEPLRGRLPLDQRWTEVVVAGLHREAMGVLIGRRAADYLASELRGQLLSREVDLVVEDRMSRGRAQKVITVRPQRFLGERLEGLGPVEVAGRPPIRLEIYLAGAEGSDDGAPRGLAIYCAGTLVAEGFHEMGALGLDHAPWTDPRLIGIVDFPGFTVAPGSRRGPVPDEAAGAFARALGGLEPILAGLLETLDRKRSEELDRSLIRELQRAFRDFYRQRPRYEMLPVQAKKSEVEGPAGAEPGSGAAGDGAEEGAGPGVEAATDEPEALERPKTPAGDLLPPGPLAEVRLSPPVVRVECRGARRLRAAALDAVGRLVEEPVEYAWSVEGDIGTLETDAAAPQQVTLRAGAQPAEGTVTVTASSGGRQAAAVSRVEVVEEILPRRPDEGIPEPELIDQPASAWRSRMMDGRWQVNVGHREYRAIADRPALKLRYLAMLFAKEVVLRSSQDPRLEKPLEQLVEVAAYADRHIGARRGRRDDA